MKKVNKYSSKITVYLLKKKKQNKKVLCFLEKLQKDRYFSTVCQSVFSVCEVKGQ